MIHRQRKANSPDRPKPLSTVHIHKLFHKVHTHVETHGLFPSFDQQYASELSSILGSPVTLPAKYLRNQVIVRCYGAPPCVETLLKLHFGGIARDIEFDFKSRFTDLVLQTADQYSLLEQCRLAEVPIKWYGHDGSAVVRPQRPISPQTAMMKKDWMTKEFFGYQHCLELSIGQKDAKVVKAECKKYATKARCLGFQKNYTWESISPMLTAPVASLASSAVNVDEKAECGTKRKCGSAGAAILSNEMLGAVLDACDTSGDSSDDDGGFWDPSSHCSGENISNAAMMLGMTEQQHKLHLAEAKARDGAKCLGFGRMLLDGTFDATTTAGTTATGATTTHTTTGIIYIHAPNASNADTRPVYIYNHTNTESALYI